MSGQLKKTVAEPSRPSRDVVPRLLTLVAVLTLALPLLHCDGTEAECAVSADCAAIEVCRQGLCILDDTAQPEPSPPEPAQPAQPEPAPVPEPVPAPEPEPAPAQPTTPEPTPPVDAGPPCIDVDGDERGVDCVFGPDCDDTDETIWIQQIGYADTDSDGVSLSEPVVLCTDGTMPVGFLESSSSPPDCNDDLEAVFVEIELYPDADADLAFSGETVTVCTDGTVPDGFSDVAPEDADCDDADPRRFPGNPEDCDALDNDCDGFADQGNTCGNGGCVVDFAAGPLNPYFFCPGPSTWGAARDGCASANYQLVVLDDQQENALVQSIANTRFGGGDWWIGLSDFANEGNYVWVNGTPLTFGNAFDGGEPNNDGNEDCIEFRGTSGWNDNQCNAGKRFVCEAVPPPYVPPDDGT